MISAIAAGHIHSPRNVGPLEGATHYGQSGIPGEGPYIQLWFILSPIPLLSGEGSERSELGRGSPPQSNALRIEDAAYRSNGCFASIASASVVAEMLKGRTVEQALSLEPQDVNALCGGLPEGKGYCAEMAIEAIRNALLPLLVAGEGCEQSELGRGAPPPI